VAEQQRGPEQRNERNAGGTDTEQAAQYAPDRAADRSRQAKGQRREREEGARDQRPDGPQIILPALVDER
jgi:hypothetical protein